LKIAVFIDFDNIEIGVKTTLNQQFDIAAILDGIKERGEVVTKIAYGDWKRAGDYGRLLSQHAIRMVQRNVTPGGDKNGADINLALDALEMAFTHNHINAFVIVGGDSDFITLVEKLKQYDKKVFVVGGRSFTSLVMQKNCHEFIAYENLVSSRRPTGPERRRGAATTGPSDLGKAIPLVKRALKVLVDREVSPQLGLLKSTLLQLDSTFSERDYGASTFRDFIEKIAKTGLLTLRQSGRSLMVDLAEDSPRSDVGTNSSSALALPQEVAARSDARPEPMPAATRQAPRAPVDAEQAKQAIERTAEIFRQASSPPRWPMYVRQVKQHLRAIEEQFDERKLGFTTITEFLRACQREGVFRLERDRSGVLRVFAGPNLQRPTGAVDTTSTHGAGQDTEQPAAEEAAQEPVRDAESQPVVEVPEPFMIDPIAGAHDQVASPEKDHPARPIRRRGTRKIAGSDKSAARRSIRAKAAGSHKRQDQV